MFIEIKRKDDSLIYVNLEHITYVLPNPSGEGCIIHLTDSKWFTNENYEDLTRRIRVIQKI